MHPIIPVDVMHLVILPVGWGRPVWHYEGVYVRRAWDAGALYLPAAALLLGGLQAPWMSGAMLGLNPSIRQQLAPTRARLAAPGVASQDASLLRFCPGTAPMVKSPAHCSLPRLRRARRAVMTPMPGRNHQIQPCQSPKCSPLHF